MFLQFHEHKSKSNQQAVEHRTLGNSLYRQNKIDDALESYNKSLCFAETGSEHVALAYGNRSAVYFEAKDYEKCLENIRLARESNYPPDKVAKLSEREEKCYQLMEDCGGGQGDDPLSYFKLSYAPNEKLPFIVNCLELREDDTYGRQIVTNQDLNPGDVIAIEDAPFKVLDEDGIYTRCANCLKCNKLSLIPSPTCTTAMFCSPKCLEYGEDKHMCAAGEGFSFIARITLQAVQIFGGDLRKMKTFLSDPEMRNKTVFDFDLSDPNDPNYLLYQLLAINSLKRIKNAIELSHLIGAHPILKRWTDKEDREIVKSFMRFIDDITYNGLKVTTWEFGKTGSQAYPKTAAVRTPKTVGHCIFPFSALFNHSCCNNIQKFSLDNKLVIFVSMPIKKGQQIFMSYGPNYIYDDLKTRQLQLEIFNFRCSCEACKYDWKTYDRLRHFDQSFKEPDEVILSMDNAKKELERNCRYIARNFRKFPSYEISRLQERNTFLLVAMASIEVQN